MGRLQAKQFPDPRFKQIGAFFGMLQLKQLASIPASNAAPGTLLASYEVPDSISQGGTLTGTGSAGTVTMTSSTDFISTDGVWVHIDTTGALGASTFSAGIDNPTRSVKILNGVPTGANVALTGTRWTLHFTAATYTAGGLFQSICSKWLDLVGAYPNSVNNFINDASAPAVGSSRPIVKSVGDFGAPCISFDGVNDFMWLISSFANTYCGGVNTPFYTVALARFNAMPGTSTNGTVISASNLTNVNAPFVEMGIANAGPAFYCNRRSDAGVSHLMTSIARYPTIGATLLEHHFDGTNGRLSQMGADVAGGDFGLVDQSSTIITPDRFSLGCRWSNAGLTGFGNFDLYALRLYSARPSSCRVALQRRGWNE